MKPILTEKMQRVWSAFAARRMLVALGMTITFAGYFAIRWFESPVVFVCQDLRTKLPVFFVMKNVPLLTAKPTEVEITVHTPQGDVFSYSILAPYARGTTEYLLGKTTGNGRAGLNTTTGSFLIEELIDGKKPDTFGAYSVAHSGLCKVQ